MGILQTPHDQMIIPFLRPNIVQISHWWITKALPILHIDIQVISTLCQNTITLSYNSRQQVNPAHLASLYKDGHTLKTTVMTWPNTPLSTVMEPPAKNTTDLNGKHQSTLEQKKTIKQYPIISSKQMDNNSCAEPSYRPSTLTQSCITSWCRKRDPTDNSFNFSSMPFGSEITPIHPTKNIRIIYQNPQFGMQIGSTNRDMHHAIMNLQILQAPVFAISSPNINWMNSSNEVEFKHHFSCVFPQIHLSAITSTPYNGYLHLPEGAAILSFNQWASRAEKFFSDPRGQASYTSTSTMVKISNA